MFTASSRYYGLPVVETTMPDGTVVRSARGRIIPDPATLTVVGTEMVVRAQPDGYTLLMVDASPAINATLYERLSFNFARDLAPVACILQTPPSSWLSIPLPFRPQRFPSSSISQRPIQAKSPCLRPEWGA